MKITVQRKGILPLSSKLNILADSLSGKVTAGFLSDSDYHSSTNGRKSKDGKKTLVGESVPLPNATIAAKLEFGSEWNAQYIRNGQNKITKVKIAVPPRPFMRAVVPNNKQQLVRYFGNFLRALIPTSVSPDIVDGHKLSLAFSSVGGRIVEAIKLSMLSPSWAPNGKFWGQFKHGNKPLVDTGELIESVDYRVEKK